MAIFQKDREGRTLLYCASCVIMREMEPKEAVTTLSGTALCEKHIHSVARSL